MQILSVLPWKYRTRLTLSPLSPPVSASSSEQVATLGPGTPCMLLHGAAVPTSKSPMDFHNQKQNDMSSSPSPFVGHVALLLLPDTSLPQGRVLPLHPHLIHFIWVLGKLFASRRKTRECLTNLFSFTGLCFPHSTWCLAVFFLLCWCVVCTPERCSTQSWDVLSSPVPQQPVGASHVPECRGDQGEQPLQLIHEPHRGPGN